GWRLPRAPWAIRSAISGSSDRLRELHNMGRASDYRKRRQSAAEPAAEITLPSGAMFICRRPPLQVWITAGKIPQSFLHQYLGREGGEGAPELTDEQTVQAIVFVRECLIYAVVEPRLILPKLEYDFSGRPELGENELWADELAPEDFEFLTQWIMAGCTGVPVRTKGGEASIESLSKFRQKRPGGRPFSLEPDGEQVQHQAEPAFTNTRSRRRS